MSHHSSHTDDRMEAFASLESEWLALIAPPVGVWEADVLAMSQQQDDLTAAGHWIGGPSDLLSVLGKSRRETFHSALIAWLLWPNARHYLGTEMLKRLLDRCFPDQFDPDTLRRCSSQTEVSRPASRADIVVEGPGLKVVIEVKVDATEGENQCQRLYADHVADRALFVFLTPTGARAKTTGDGECADAWAPLSFRDLRDDLKACLASVPPNDSGGWATARSYLETLGKEFP